MEPKNPVNSCFSYSEIKIPKRLDLTYSKIITSARKHQHSNFCQNYCTHGKSWEKATSFSLSNKSTFLAYKIS
jgi:hypothetical protein